MQLMVPQSNDIGRSSGSNDISCRIVSLVDTTRGRHERLHELVISTIVAEQVCPAVTGMASRPCLSRAVHSPIGARHGARAVQSPIGARHGSASLAKPSREVGGTIRQAGDVSDMASRRGEPLARRREEGAAAPARRMRDGDRQAFALLDDRRRRAGAGGRHGSAFRGQLDGLVNYTIALLGWMMAALGGHTAVEEASFGARTRRAYSPPGRLVDQASPLVIMRRRLPSPRARSCRLRSASLRRQRRRAVAITCILLLETFAFPLRNSIIEKEAGGLCYAPGDEGQRNLATASGREITSLPLRGMLREEVYMHEAGGSGWPPSRMRRGAKSADTTGAGIGNLPGHFTDNLAAIRIGEAKNPGPGNIEDGGSVNVGKEEDLPPWSRGSVPFYQVDNKGRIHAELIPPHLVDITRQERQGHLMADNELEDFLDGIEEEHGWYRCRQSRAQEDWDDYEKLKSGIAVPELGIAEAPTASDHGLVTYIASAPRGDRRRAPIEAGGPGGQGMRKAEGGKKRAEAISRWRNLPGMPPIEELEGGSITAEAEEEAAQQVQRQQQRERGDARSDGGVRVNRKRGAGRKGGGRAIVYMFNSSGRPQLEQAMEGVAENRRRVVAMLSQEHHAREDTLPDLEAMAKRKKWKMAATPATSGEGGRPSAGTAVFVPDHLGWGTPTGKDWDFSPPGSKGRVAAAWIHTSSPGGLLCISVYWWTSEGASHRNLRILRSALDLAASHGAPWIIGADFNAEPAELMEAAATMINRAGAVLMSPSTPTHYPAEGRARTLDYFIIDERIAKSVTKVGVAHDVVTTSYRAAQVGHRVVYLELDQKAMGGSARMIRRPKDLPREATVSCGRSPVLPKRDYAIMLQQSVDEESRMGVLSMWWRDLAGCLEAEVARRCDIVGEQGLPPVAYTGRGNGFQTAWRQILPARADGPDGGGDQTTHGLIWLATRLDELKNLAGKPSATWAAASRRQWCAITGKLRRSQGLMKELIKEKPEWAAALDELSACTPGDGDRLRHFLELARAQIRCRKEEERSRRKKEWNKWILQQGRCGGGALHKYVKRQLDPPSHTVLCQGERSGAPQDIVDADLVEWNEIWKKNCMASAPWREGEEVLDEDLPPIGVDDLRKAMRSFKARTGVGGDLVPPSWLLILSDALVEHFAAFFMAVEDMGRWPRELQVALMHLIPKLAGGRRPIGILATVIRWWEKSRRGTVRQWRARNARRYDWAASGKSSEQGVWVQSIRHAAARARGDHLASTLLDLAKAYEHVPLEAVWSAGIRKGYPRKILRLTLEACSFTRYLYYKGVLSSPTQTLTAVIAGMTFSTDLLFLLLTDVADDLLISHPSLDLCMYVDDLRMTAVGSEESTARTILQATDQCIRDLEERCRLVVSRARTGKEDSKAKSVTLASAKGLARRLKAGMRRLGIKQVKKAVHLGVGVSLTGPGRGGVGIRSEQKRRWTSAVSRKARLQRLGRHGAPRVVRTGWASMVRYGVTTTGVTDSVLNKLASAGATAMGNMGGRSKTARLAIRDQDIRVPIIILPVEAWSTAVWNSEVPDEELLDAWRQAQREVGLASRPHAAVRDGAGAYIAALKRLGWLSPSPTTVITRGRAQVDLKATDPRTVKRFAIEDAKTMLAAKSEVAMDIHDLGSAKGYYRFKKVEEETEADGPDPSELAAARVWQGGKYEVVDSRVVPWFLLARIFLRSTWGGGKHHSPAKESAMACVEGGWWTQSRLRAAKLTKDAICRACSRMKGTLWHRLGRCDVNEQLRDETWSPELRKRAEIDKWDPLYYRCVPGLPKVDLRLPSEAHDWGVDGQPRHGALATGDVFSDGSVKGLLWGATRGGWGVAVVSEEGMVQWSLGGTCQDWHPTSLRSELRGVLEALRRAAPPIRLHVDCQAVVDGVNEGRAYCTSSRREGADLWRKIWPLIEDIGLSSAGLTFIKVKAHCTLDEVREGRLSMKEWVGNAAADRAAKRGCQLACRLCPISAPHAALRRAISWYRWVATLTVQWPADTEEMHDGGAEEAAHEEERRSRRGPDFLPHLIWKMGSGDLLCRRCGRQAPKENAAKTRVMWSSRCQGTAAGRLMGQMASNAGATVRHCMYPASMLLMKGGRPAEEEIGNLSDLEASSEEEAVEREGEGGGAPADGEEQEEVEQSGDGPPTAEAEVISTAGGGRAAIEQQRQQGRPSGSCPDRKRGRANEEEKLVAERKAGEGGERDMDAATTGALAEAATAAAAAVDERAGPKMDRKRHRALLAAEVGGWRQVGLTTAARKRRPEDEENVDGQAGKFGRLADGGAGTDATLASARGIKRTAEDVVATSPSRMGTSRRLVGKQPARGPEAAGSSTDAAVALAQPGTVRRRLMGKQSVASVSGSVEADGTGTVEDGEVLSSRSSPAQRDIGSADVASSSANPLTQHQLRLTGPMAWCARCGHHAMQRVRGLGGACAGRPEGVYAIRLRRLLEGRHPISGKPLDALI